MRCAADVRTCTRTHARAHAHALIASGASDFPARHHVWHGRYSPAPNNRNDRINLDNLLQSCSKSTCRECRLAGSAGGAARRRLSIAELAGRAGRVASGVLRCLAPTASSSRRVRRRPLLPASQRRPPRRAVITAPHCRRDCRFCACCWCVRCGVSASPLTVPAPTSCCANDAPLQRRCVAWYSGEAGRRSSLRFDRPSLSVQVSHCVERVCAAYVPARRVVAEFMKHQQLQVRDVGFAPHKRSRSDARRNSWPWRRRRRAAWRRRARQRHRARRRRR